MHGCAGGSLVVRWFYLVGDETGSKCRGHARLARARGEGEGWGWPRVVQPAGLKAEQQLVRKAKAQDPQAMRKLGLVWPLGACFGPRLRA